MIAALSLLLLIANCRYTHEPPLATPHTPTRQNDKLYYIIHAVPPRLVLLILLVYGVFQSSMVVTSCHFMSALSTNGTAHGVGLLTFESKDGDCVAHNSFVVDNYNGMELTARVGGYVAPSLGALSALLLSSECFKGGCLCGKCIPALALMFSSVFQGLTFLLFWSDLFCSNTDVISECDMGDAGYRSVQSCLVYAFCLVLYYAGPTPEPCTTGYGVGKRGKSILTESALALPSSTLKEGESKKKKKKKSEPGKGEDWTKEMYEQRRKEKKSKSRGVSGRSKEEIFDDLHDSGRANGKKKRKSKKSHHHVSEDRLALYKPKDGKKKNRTKKGSSGRRGSQHSQDSSRSHSQSDQDRFDDYVDTEPDGMDWSAYTPEQREAYYERQRIKKKERKERERERETAKLREWEDQLNHRRGVSSPSPSPSNNEYDYSPRSTEYDDSYYGPGPLNRHADDGEHSYYSARDEGSGYDMERQQRYRHPEVGRGGRNYGGDDRRHYSRGCDDDYTYDDYTYDDYTHDDYTYDDTQRDSEYSYSQDPPPNDDGYSYDQTPSSRLSSSIY
jgi:hypothetical protein